MNVKDVTGVLIGAPSYSLLRLAKVFGVTRNYVDRWRSDNPAHQRRPPQGWEAVIAAEARTHARELREHADSLMGVADELERVVAEPITH